eukprot:12787913-Alexandrium_andersonii.AAC.1
MALLSKARWRGARNCNGASGTRNSARVEGTLGPSTGDHAMWWPSLCVCASTRGASGDRPAPVAG